MIESTYIAPALDRSVGLRRQVTFQAMRVFSGWGYREIQVPLIDYFDVLKSGLDDTQIEQTFRFVDPRGNVMMLRTDVTPAIAKIVAYQLRSHSLPLRVSYANKVVRIDRSVEGSNPESYSLGVELIGVRGLVGELEVILVALEVLERLGLGDFQFNVTDHGIASYLLNATGAPRRIRSDVREAIVARDADEVARILRQLGIRRHFVEAISALASLEGGLQQLSQIEKALPDDRELVRRLDEMRRLFGVLSELGHRNKIRLDMAELGGAQYYTGIAFNIVSETVGRSLGRGGRYDELVGVYGSPAPAVGFSLSAEALVELLDPFTNRTERVEDVADEIVVRASSLAEGLEEALSRRRFNKSARIVSPDGR
jgi:ATP phosphoribosyltransferase regulatory subunit